MKELNIEAKTDNLQQVLDHIDNELMQADCPMTVQIQIDIAVEEMFVNIASYAYEGGTGMAKIGIEISDDNLSARIVLTDQGIPFDPLATPDPDVTLSADERQIGGLGIYMVKKTVDEIDYRYEDGRNIPFSDGLKLFDRYYFSPALMPRQLFRRCAGPGRLRGRRRRVAQGEHEEQAKQEAGATEDHEHVAPAAEEVERPGSDHAGGH